MGNGALAKIVTTGRRPLPSARRGGGIGSGQRGGIDPLSWCILLAASGLMRGKFARVDRPIAIAVDCLKRGRVRDIAHPIALLRSLADSFSPTLVKLLLDDFSVSIDVIIGE